MQDDLIPFLDEQGPDTSPEDAGFAWKVLVVDDDEEVHQATRFVLNRQHILGHPVRLDSVYSAAEAQDFLRTNRDTAVVFLDVVMETDDAGLRLVETLRGEMGLEELRIILRTGQAGYAPELEVINRYDINDYRTKSELTHTRLITSLTSALRSYQQIHQLNVSRQGLNQIISATRDLLSYGGFSQFAKGVLTQIGAFLDLSANEGLIIFSVPKSSNMMRFASIADGAIVAATGRYETMQARSLHAMRSDPKFRIISRAFEKRENIFTDQGFALACDGQQYTLLIYLDIDRPIHEDEQRLLSVFCQNIALCSDNLALIEHLHSQAYNDELTLLPNRLSLTDALRQALQAPSGKILVLLDVDHFNSLYESTGQDSTEQLLQQYAARLQSHLADRAELIARIGGDTFAILADRERLCDETVGRLLCTDLAIDDFTLKVRSTAALIPLDAADFTPERLMSAAHATMKEAKRDNRGNLSHYRGGLIEEIHDNATLLQALTHAVEQEDFRLVYQPKWDLGRQRFHGLESLIRWRHGGQWISPADFIPLAESSGLIVRLGQWVLGRACEEYARLLEGGRDPGPIAVNVSGAQFRDEQFVQMLQDSLQRFGIRPASMILEITETAAINNGIEEAISRLRDIRALGVQIALDDFGTGYSSLSYLQRFPVDQLKIDRDFTQTVLHPDGREVVRSIIEVSHALDLRVVAEGAERMEEVERLRALGCDFVQGYVYARPMPMDDLIPWLSGDAGAAPQR